MSKITTTLTSDRQLEACSGEHRITVDLPQTVGGDNRAPAPLDYYALSLSSCVASLIIAYCDNHNLDSTGLNVDIEYKKVVDPTRLSQVKLTATLPRVDLSKRETALRHVVEHCPIIDMEQVELVLIDKNNYALVKSPGTTLQASPPRAITSS